MIRSAKVDTSIFERITIAMFTRTPLDTRLSDLGALLVDRTSDPTRVSPDEFEFHLDAVDPVLTVKGKEIPAGPASLEVVGNFLNVPTSFLKRMVSNTSGGTQNLVLGEILRNTVTKDMGITTNKSGEMLTEITEWDSKARIRPHQVVEAVGKGLGRINPEVARLVDETHQFAFDVYAPFTGKTGVGGDRTDKTKSKVGDLTSAGVRVDVNLKQGLAPSVQPFSYRLICTNGMETPHFGLKIDARAKTVEEVMAELESMAQLAFAQAEKDVEHFYDLRNQRVPNAERAITAIARERGIPDRSTMEIIRLAAGEDMPDNPTMFDVVNLITNYANSDAVRNDGGRLLLERAGGAVVGDHAARCGHCNQKVQE